MVTYKIYTRDEFDVETGITDYEFNTQEEAIAKAIQLSYDTSNDNPTVYVVYTPKEEIFWAINKSYNWCIENNCPLLEEYAPADNTYFLTYSKVYNNNKITLI